MIFSSNEAVDSHVRQRASKLALRHQLGRLLVGRLIVGDRPADPRPLDSKFVGEDVEESPLAGMVKSEISSRDIGRLRPKKNLAAVRASRHSRIWVRSFSACSSGRSGSEPPMNGSRAAMSRSAWSHGRRCG